MAFENTSKKNEVPAKDAAPAAVPPQRLFQGKDLTEVQQQLEDIVHVITEPEGDCLSTTAEMALSLSVSEFIEKQPTEDSEYGKVDWTVARNIIGRIREMPIDPSISRIFIVRGQTALVKMTRPRTRRTGISVKIVVEEAVWIHNLHEVQRIFNMSIRSFFSAWLAVMLMMFVGAWAITH